MIKLEACMIVNIWLFIRRKCSMLCNKMIGAGLLSKNRKQNKLALANNTIKNFYNDAISSMEEQLSYESEFLNVISRYMNKHGYYNKCRVDFAQTENTYRFVVYPTSFYACEITRDKMKRLILNKFFKYKFFTFDQFKFVTVLPNNYNGNNNFKNKDRRNWKPQIDFLNMFPNFNNLLTNLHNYTRNAKKLLSSDFGIFLLDVTRFLLELRDGYFTPTKLISNFISLYTINYRYKKMFPETNNLTDLLMGMAALGLPHSIIEQVKAFSLLTGRKLFDNDFLMDSACALFELLISILDFFSHRDNGFVSTLVSQQLIVFIKNMGSKFIAYKKIKKVANIYSAFVKDGTRMFDPTFRKEIKDTYDDCNGDNAFLDYVLNGSNGYFKTTWGLFKDNVVKSAVSFESASRDEPICIVFEGEAGSGKSVLMTQYVELLRARGTTVYTHTVPAAEDGKDFYDDYANQEVFVMDDIGQQGKSQWRYIINYVSPVKYPLPCANANLKNTKFFNSKIILCTTNALMSLGGFTNTDCISTPEALFRRCHVIKVDKTANTEYFQQSLKYYKYDFRSSQRWVNDFLYHQKTDSIEPTLVTSERNALRETLTFVHKVVSHIQAADEIDRRNLVQDEAFYQAIIDNVEERYQDAVNEFRPNALEGLALPLCDLVDYAQVFITNVITTCGEHVDNLYGLISNMLTSSTDNLFCNFLGFRINLLTGITILSLFSIVITYLFRYQRSDNFKAKMEVCKSDQEVLKYFPQTTSERVEVIRRFCKTVVIKDETSSVITQAVVSGDKIMLPAHANVVDKFLDVYTTYEHYENGHKEMENLQVAMVKVYMTVDIAIYRVTKAIPLWKHCNNLFVDAAQQNPIFYLVNSIKTLPVVMGHSVTKNTDKVVYTSYVGAEKRVFAHDVGSGYYTGIAGSGLCGTVLCTNDGGVVGFHVAGNDCDVGFCVAPSASIRNEIRNIMLQGKEPSFDIDRKVMPGLSGVRLRYENMDVSHTNGESQFVKTVFHRDVCPEMDSLEKSISEYTDSIVVDHKAPPRFKCKGSPTVLLKETSKKTMKHQGMVTREELAYIGNCLSTLIPAFDDIEDDVVAFGNKEIPALNKDSSNGYGCMKSKTDYFDFDNKVIKQSAVDVIERFRKAAREEDYNPSLFVCRETFKDELRKASKVDSPRTFRVMPMPHIWWTKKIFGSLGPHYKQRIHQTGICLGLNPYKDFSIIHGKLSECNLHGDVDFSKWDGSIMAPIMQLIGDLFKDKYKGKYAYVIDYLFNTMSTSMVMVSDELWSTTHGLPSGTWLTLLLNCLLNRALTALTLHRNMQAPTISDFDAIVDYVTGDDKIFGVPEAYENIFNLLTLSKTATSLGMECTNGDKTPIVSKSQDFAKLNFVKRDFHYHPQIREIVGKLSIDTIINTLQWYDSSKELTECMEGKMRSVQVEAYLHSRALFVTLTNLFKKYYPTSYYLTEDKVVKILATDDGYNFVMTGLGKDMSYNL